MEPRRRVSLSKYLSFVLRHRPDAIGLELEPGGWLSCEALVQAARRQGYAITAAELLEVVATNPKRRFELTADQTRVRAVQGHSVAVELGYLPSEPPEILFHGTSLDVLEIVLASGLTPQKRTHVHLSPSREQALQVARRRARPTIVLVRAFEMYRAGHEFLKAPNGVWLTAYVPPEFVRRE